MPEKVVRKRPRLSPMNVLSLMTVNWKVILSELIMMKRWSQMNGLSQVRCQMIRQTRRVLIRTIPCSDFLCAY